MAIANIYRLHSIVFQHATIDVVVGAMSTADMATDTELIREVNASSYYPKQSHLNYRSVSFTFTSWDLEQLIALIQLGGLCVKSGNTYTSIELWIAKYDCNTQLNTDSTKYVLNEAIIFPQSLNVDHQGNAQITYQAIGIFDGTNATLIKTTSQPLPTILAGSESRRWTMHDFKLNTVAIAQKKSIGIDFGVQASTDGADSDQFDTWVALNQALPSMTIQGINPDWLGTNIPSIEGLTAEHADTRVQLKDRDEVIENPKHIHINIGGNARITTPMTGNANDAVGTTMTIEPIEVGSNIPIVIAAKQIIT